jgi:outer membrane lipoprotein-sorting protein
MEEAAPIMQMISMILPSMMLLNVDSTDEETVLIELLGTEEYNKKSCKKIRIAPKENPDGSEQIIYTDAQSNWLVALQMGPISLNLEGMKKVKGYVYPSVIKIMSNGTKLSEIEISKIEADIDLEDSLFTK